MTDIKEKYPEVDRAWQQGGSRPHIPGEESREQFLERTRAFLHDLRAKHADGRVLVVSHGGTINMLLMVSLSLDIERALPFSIENASINIIQFGDRGAPPPCFE